MDRIDLTYLHQSVCSLACDISNYRIRIFLQYIFALPALGFYYYQYLKIKDFFAKTLNDVRLDMGGKVYTATVFTTDYYSIFYR